MIFFLHVGSKGVALHCKIRFFKLVGFKKGAVQLSKEPPSLVFDNLITKLDGLAPLIADLPPLKLHQQEKSTPSVK